MKKPVLIALGVIAVAIAIYYFTRVQNPTLKWEVEPDYTENGDGVYGPRDQRDKPGGGSHIPITVKIIRENHRGWLILVRLFQEAWGMWIPVQLLNLNVEMEIIAQ